MNMDKELQTKYLMKDQEVEVKKYDYMLGVLPPIRMVHNGFLVGEPVRHGEDTAGRFRALYDLYFSHDGKYYAGGLASTKDFDTWIVPIAKVHD